MENIVLNANQAFQLAALGPCILIIGYILLSSTKFSLSILPVLFFISLSGIFAFPILEYFPEFSNSQLLKTISLNNDKILPALSFLLILQFVLGKKPPLIYWSVFAIPFIGGGPLTYLAINHENICLVNDLCYEPAYLNSLYTVFGASLMFMLLTVVINRTDFSISKKDKMRRHKYWLIITLVGFNLLIIGNDLALVAGNVVVAEHSFIKTMAGVGFVYVVISSVFRVFSEALGIRPWIPRSGKSIAKDRWLAERITWILREEKPYVSLGFNRKAMAEILGEQEHTVSRVVNERFGKTFSELMNECRVHDAKKALRESKDPVTVISFDSGFSSITSFNRVFKEATGLSPSQYRKEKDGANDDHKSPNYLN